MKDKPKILLVNTGGTITMLRDKMGTLSPGKDTPYEDRNVLLEKIPELRSLADIELLQVSNVDSSNIMPDLWLATARAIYKRMKQYDGFVVTHGTDTLSYTSAALSFMLQELPKPVVFTGAQVPLEDIGSDGRCNLINALRVAVSDFAECAVVFGSEIIRGTRVKKTSAFDMQALTSVKSVPLGNIGLVIKFNASVKTRSSRKALFQPFLNENVAMVPVYPGFKPEILEYLASTHEGIVLEGFGAGNLPTGELSLIPQIQEAFKRKIPVVVCTQCIIGSTQMELYQVGRAALEVGAIPAMDMTPETSLVKLMWVLGQTSDPSTVDSMMRKSYVGELHEFL